MIACKPIGICEGDWRGGSVLLREHTALAEDPGLDFSTRTAHHNH